MENLLFLDLPLLPTHIFERYILDDGKWVNKQDHKKRKLIHYLSHYGLIEHLNFVISIHQNEWQKKDIILNNPLHYAAYSGSDPYLVHRLIQLGINPLDNNKNGESSIHLSSNPEITSYFLFWLEANHINIDTVLDNNFNNILHAAKHYGFVESYNFIAKRHPTLLDKKNKFNKLPKDLQNKNNKILSMS